MTPDGTHELNCYVDTDSACCFMHETAHDKASVLSRTGYVINYSGFPILCVSKMQTEIALSTTVAEYIALSQGMRDLIPLREILQKLSTLLKINNRIDNMYLKSEFPTGYHYSIKKSVINEIK